MSGDEALARWRDYRCAGWQLLFILHRGRYRGRATTDLERALGPIPHYYAQEKNRDVQLYDLLPLAGRRFLELPLIALQLQHFDQKTVDIPPLYQQLTLPLRQRTEQWPLHLAGDFLDQLIRAPSELFLQLQRKYPPFLPITVWGKLKRSIKLLLQLLLEQHSLR